MDGRTLVPNLPYISLVNGVPRSSYPSQNAWSDYVWFQIS